MTDMEMRTHLIDRHRVNAKRLPYQAHWDVAQESAEPVFTTLPRPELDTMHIMAHSSNRFRKGRHYHKEADNGDRTA